MTKEELELEAEEWVKKDCCNDCCAQNCKDWCREVKHKYRAYLVSAEPREKRIADLEQKISVLLSCKNCPENKGGFICVKEYENKCLAQKIQYIKELQEENKVLAQNLEDTEILNKTYEKKNAELKKQLEMSNKVYNDNLDYSHHIEEQLTKAKEIIKKLKALYFSPVVTKDDVKRQDEILAEAERFLKECK